MARCAPHLRHTDDPKTTTVAVHTTTGSPPAAPSVPIMAAPSVAHVGAAQPALPRSALQTACGSPNPRPMSPGYGSLNAWQLTNGLPTRKNCHPNQLGPPRALPQTTRTQSLLPAFAELAIAPVALSSPALAMLCDPISHWGLAATPPARPLRPGPCIPVAHGRAIPVTFGRTLQLQSLVSARSHIADTFPEVAPLRRLATSG